MQHATSHDVFIGVAAVADYRPATPAEHKIKKEDGAPPQIELVRNPDILAEVVALPSPPLCVGFAAESRNLAEYAERKRRSKNIPLIVGNLIQDGFGGDCNALVLFDAAGETPPRLEARIGTCAGHPHRPTSQDYLMATPVENYVLEKTRRIVARDALLPRQRDGSRLAIWKNRPIPGWRSA